MGLKIGKINKNAFWPYHPPRGTLSYLWPETSGPNGLLAAEIGQNQFSDPWDAPETCSLSLSENRIMGLKIGKINKNSFWPYHPPRGTLSYLWPETNGPNGLLAAEICQKPILRQRQWVQIGAIGALALISELLGAVNFSFLRRKKKLNLALQIKYPLECAPRRNKPNSKIQVGAPPPLTGEKNI